MDDSPSLRKMGQIAAESKPQSSRRRSPERGSPSATSKPVKVPSPQRDERTQLLRSKEHWPRATRPGWGGEPPGPPAPPERSSLVIFVDWDDTLFPTTELIEQAYLEDGMGKQTGHLPPAIAQQVRALEEDVLQFLIAARAKGTLVIVTNAARGWIERLTEWAMPRVGLYMTRQCIAVRYARECPAAVASNVDSWKKATFSYEAAQARDRLSRDRPLSLVSVGDMPYERDAAHCVSHPDDTVKTIKFLEEPSLRELQHELRALVRAMPSLTESGKSRSVDLEMQPRDGAAQAPPCEGIQRDPGCRDLAA